MDGMAAAVSYDLDAVTLSGLEATPDESPRATIVALHGGGYSAGYFDHPVEPSSSLLTLGALLGYRVVAIDRPGYGTSEGLVGVDVRVARQVPLLFELIDELDRRGPTGAGCFLVGHSMGSIVAIHMAASPRGAELLGLEVSGVPLRFPADFLLTEDNLANGPDYMPASTIEQRRGLFYGPDGSFDPAALAADVRVSRPVPAAEIIDAVRCGGDMPALAATVTIPVQFTRAAHEASSLGGREVLGAAEAMFTASHRFVGHWQEGAGHNIGLHKVARAYHLRILAFFEEVLAAGAP
jgi:pimeloyl-ACP methyl ester carboxylesterase